jgi:beta-glucanase (GH16 family)
VSRILSRARAVAVAAACVTAAGLIASCGNTPDPGTPANVFDALPPTATTLPPASTTTAPPTTTPTTTKAKAKPATARPPRRTRTTPDAGTAPGAVGPQWKPAGGDEFNAGAVDTKKWGLYDSVGAFGNGSRKPSAISEGGGSLSITQSNNDTSGGMADSYSQLYGRWEVRVRTDLGRGFGSVALLWPNSESTNDGEIDIMEVPNERRDRANFVLHSGQGGTTQIGTDVAGAYQNWHTFTVEWLPTSITWYIDGVKHYGISDKARIPTKPMHLALQFDQGPKENWIATPDATTPPDMKMQVDYARVWSWANSPAAANTARPAPQAGDNGGAANG